MAGKRKQFQSTPLKRLAAEAFELDAKGFANLAGPNGRVKKLQVARYLGQGIDEWVWRCLAEIQELLGSESVAVSTALHYWRSGLCKLFEFLVAHKPGLTLANLQPSDVNEFIGWLRIYPTFDPESSSAISAYGCAKPILVTLQSMGDILYKDELFPVNPFPGSNAAERGAMPLSESEQGRLELAVRKDLIGLHRDAELLSSSEALISYLLAFAIRVGPNTTPLLELRQTELKDHAWVPNMKVLRFEKRRGNSTFIKSLRYTETVVGQLGVRPEAGVIYQILLVRARELDAEAIDEEKGLLFLYRSSSIRNLGKVVSLDQTSLRNGLRRFVERHQLEDEAGAALQLNLSRLRKTRGVNLWELTPDPVRVSAEMNNSESVLNTNYHAVTERMTLNAGTVVDSLVDSWRAAKTAPEPAKNTPVSGCHDPKEGQHAPKNGADCVDFESCITCDSFALVESEKDLHRFFSFYWHLVHRSTSHPSADERTRLSELVSAIDTFCSQKLNQDLAANARALARTNPIRFWRIHGAPNGSSSSPS